MSEYDAHGFINNINTGERPGGMLYTLIGDDPNSNDHGLGSGHWFPGGGPRPGGQFYAAVDGIHYLQEISVPKAELNEDDGVFDDTDEVYAQANFIDSDGTPRWQTSNVITNIF